MPGQIIGLFGMAVFIALAWAISSSRRLFPWRTVAWGLGLQLVFAGLILKTSWGELIFKFTGQAITKLIEFSSQGATFVFGPLANDPSMKRVFPEQPLVFAVLVTATIILVAALASLLYHWGVLQRVVSAMAWVMRRTMGTSGSETLAAAANVFMGQTEAPLLVKPYIAGMTRSELLCLMTGGMATIAGGVGAVYVKLGVDAGHPDMAGHILTASVLSAPSALLISKVMLPETEESETADRATRFPERVSRNSVDALCRGAGDGMMLSLNVIAMLVAFIAVVALANFLFMLPQTWLGVAAPVNLQTVLGWMNAPFAWLMGVPAAECSLVGRILGERIVLNEFIAYLSLTNPETQLSERGFYLATYALCGFANFASIAVQVGGIGSLVPERRAELAELGWRAMLGGLLASYITATVAGIFI